MSNETFVDANAAAQFFGIKRRFLLDLSRKGIRGAYPVGTGEIRKRWIFRISELAEALAPNSSVTVHPPVGRLGGATRFSPAPMNITRDVVLRRPVQRDTRYDPNIRQSPLK